jgi:hypothetical protein
MCRHFAISPHSAVITLQVGTHQVQCPALLLFLKLIESIAWLLIEATLHEGAFSAAPGSTLRMCLHSSRSTLTRPRNVVAAMLV